MSVAQTVRTRPVSKELRGTGQGVGRNVATAVLFLLSVLWMVPLLFILLNSFKGKFFISSSPFSLPAGDKFVGLENYETGLQLSGFLRAIGWSLFITVGSVLVIVMLTAMTAYYITRVKSW